MTIQRGIASFLSWLAIIATFFNVWIPIAGIPAVNAQTTPPPRQSEVYFRNGVKGTVTDSWIRSDVAGGRLNSDTLKSTKLLEFDFLSELQALSEGRPIVSAELLLYGKYESTSEAYGANLNGTVYPVKRDWDLATTTWQNYRRGSGWQTPGGIGAQDVDARSRVALAPTQVRTPAASPYDSLINSPEGRARADVFNIVKNLMTGYVANQNDGKLRLLIDAEGFNAYSSELSNPERFRPSLRITYEDKCVEGLSIDVAFVLDVSSSMNRPISRSDPRRRIDAAKAAIIEVANRFESSPNAASIRSSLVVFDRNARTKQSLTNDHARFKSVVNDITSTGPTGTVIGLGINKARQELGTASSSTKRFMVVLSDGQDTGPNVEPYFDLGGDKPLIRADEARAQGIDIYSVAIDTQVVMPGIATASSQPTHYFYDPSGEQFSTIFNAIASAIMSCSTPPVAVQFCTRDATDPNPVMADKRRVYGAKVEMVDHTDRGLVLSEDARGNVNDAYPAVQTNGNNPSDACSNWEFMNYEALRALPSNEQLTSRATHPDYSSSIKPWKFDNSTLQIVYIEMCPVNTTCNDIVPQKAHTPSVLTPASNELSVTVSFRPQTAISNVSIKEFLAPNLSFVSQPEVKLRYTPNGGATSDIAISSQPPTQAVNGKWDWVFTPNQATLEPGTYAFIFKVRYDGPNGTDIPIDREVQLNGAVDCAQSAHIDYVDATNANQCKVIPKDGFTRTSFALSLKSDAFLTDTAGPIVFDNESLKVGRNTLVVSGRPVTGAGATSSKNISGYDLPTVGKVAWSTIWTKLDERVARAKKTNATNVSCPPQGLLPSSLHLDAAVTTLGANPAVASGKKGVWILPRGCNLTINTTDLTGVGGTIVNMGGSLTIRGAINPLSSATTLGYISDGPITIMDQAQPNNVALLTNNAITLAQVDGSVTSPISKKYEAKLLAQRIIFPVRGSLRADISIEPSTALKMNVPPLLEEFTLPGALYLQ